MNINILFRFSRGRKYKNLTEGLLDLLCKGCCKTMQG